MASSIDIKAICDPREALKTSRERVDVKIPLPAVSCPQNGHANAKAVKARNMSGSAEDAASHRRGACVKDRERVNRPFPLGTSQLSAATGYSNKNKHWGLV
jgi:hypothetical protein